MMINTNNLTDVCQHLLDNCDLQLKLHNFPKIDLTFFVFGSVNGQFYQVTFLCQQTIHINMSLDDDIKAKDFNLVVGVTVEQTKLSMLPSEIKNAIPIGKDCDIWVINIYGDITIQLITTSFAWHLKTLCEREYLQRYD